MDHGGRGEAVPTLNTLIWQLAECKCSVYSPFSFCLNVSICTRKGTPFSPPCFLGVNSVLMQCTWEGRRGAAGGGARRLLSKEGAHLPGPLTSEALPDQLSPGHCSRPADPRSPLPPPPEPPLANVTGSRGVGGDGAA